MPEDDGRSGPRFAGPIVDGSRRPDPYLCRQLRTKTMYVPDSYGERDISRSGSTQQFWCLKTMRSDGPDGDLALPEYCLRGRSCFEEAISSSDPSAPDAPRP